MAKVTVYYFSTFDPHLGVNRISERAATLEAITHIHGRPVMLTAHEVDEETLDGNGFGRERSSSYQRRSSQSG